MDGWTVQNKQVTVGNQGCIRALDLSEKHNPLRGSKLN